MASSNGIGAYVRSVEDDRFIAGRGTHLHDINRPDRTYGCFARSPHVVAEKAAD